MASSGPRTPWTKQQLAVIDAAPSARLIVQAGPGTGKTATACGRIARLVAKGVPATRILLVSFTRTAVAELRDRIAKENGDALVAASVRVATVDSEAWRLAYGFGTEEAKKLFGSFDANLAHVIDALARKDELLVEYLEGIRHLIVDEAQDLVGLRATLLTRIIEVLESECGVTVFTDPAQAIYGFSADGSEKESGATGTFTEGLKGFTTFALTAVHRTVMPGLLSICRELRLDVLKPAEDGWKVTKEAIRTRADGVETDGQAALLNAGDGVMVLYRQRAEALMASSRLAEKGVRHRQRLSGFPTMIYPWVGQLFGEVESPSMTRTAFVDRWTERLGPARLGMSSGDAWGLLERIAGMRGDRIDLEVLRDALSRAQPPLELVVPDHGVGGPIVGTIHASKGREADEVLLFLPPSGAKDGTPQVDEERRVLFVGATRARKSLRVCEGSFIYNNGEAENVSRWWRPIKEKSGAVQVEVGRDGDLDVLSPVRKDWLTRESAAEMQQKIADRSARIVRLSTNAMRQTNWQHVLRFHDASEPACGRLSGKVTSDLWSIANWLSRTGRGHRPPDSLLHLWSYGARTVVLSRDSAECEALHEPWRTTGMFVVPVVRGVAWSTFQPFWGKR